MTDIQTPPPLLDGPVSLTLEGKGLAALNRYRQRYHAWSMHPGCGGEGERLNSELDEAATELCRVVARLVEQ